jgi:biopolymer transport protein ExbB
MSMLARICRSPLATFCFMALIVVVVSLAVTPEWQLAFGQEPAAGEGEAKGEKKNLIFHLITSLGIVFGPLLALISLVLVALIVLLFLDLRMGIAIPPGFVEEFTDTVNKRRFKEAFDLARNDSSFLGRVLTAGMSRLQYGLEDAREAAANMLESIRAGKEQLNNYTAVIGTLGPLLGLVGTVFGMILSFMELGVKGKTPDPSALAEGISHALVVTLFGIGLAVPAIFFNAFFRNRIIRVSMDTGNIADDLLTQMYHNSKKAGPAPSAAAPAAPVNTAVRPG